MWRRFDGVVTNPAPLDAGWIRGMLVNRKQFTFSPQPADRERRASGKSKTGTRVPGIRRLKQRESEFPEGGRSMSTPGTLSPQAQKKPNLKAWIHDQGPRWLRYLYFLRFSLALWLFAPILCLVNLKDQTLTSGVLVPDFWQQYLCIGFFLASAGLAALALARIVLINGPERWDLNYERDQNQEGSRPRFLTNLLVNDDSKKEFQAVVASQLPNLFVLLYMTSYGSSQGVSPWTILGGLLGGFVIAGVFWWLPNAWYYLTYRTPKGDSKVITFVLGKNAARTILYPRKTFWLNKPGCDLLLGRPSIEQAITSLEKAKLLRFLVRYSGYEKLVSVLAEQPGYGTDPCYGNTIYESHSFAFIAVFAFCGLYFLIWPLTAPVSAPVALVIAIVAMVLFLAAVLYVFWTVKPPQAGEEKPAAETQDWIRKSKLRQVKVGLTIGAVVFIACVIGLVFTSRDRFPIFATVLIMMVAACWVLGGLAFFLDRYRVPVLTVLILLMVFPRILHWDHNPITGGSQEEHYLSTTEIGEKPSLSNPKDIVQAHLSNIHDGRPLIIVTATGGGLHASAWTAAVLGQLELQLGSDFHKHLLLASTVSGGSVGLLTYLHELREGNLDRPDSAAAIDRMQAVAQCSSLDAVGWGLVYYDLPKAFIPLLPYFIPPSPGVGDLSGTLLRKDRTWSLRRAFERNLVDADGYCGLIWKSDQISPPTWNRTTSLNGMSLNSLTQTASFPAFTMNTTVAETGERFLSANYAIPYQNLEFGPNYRARSYLATFNPAANANQKFSDLPLATAAQMSATFPFVSSAARVPLSVDDAPNSVHFVDGGYYDNDGTASAIEFLHYALSPPVTDANDKSGAKTPPAVAAQPGQPSTPPLRILLIEIRNSGDIAGSNPESAPFQIPKQRAWNLLNQVGAPLLGFWQAGHESVTARNQSGLELLEAALGDRLQLHRIVFADLCSTDVADTDPLNWALTPRQRKEVVETSRVRLQPQYQKAKKWFDPAPWNLNAGTEDDKLSYACRNN
jgi:hypothetical protein